MENNLSTEELHERIMDYAAYTLTSARAMYREPQSYGPMRLADALDKVLELLHAVGIQDEAVDGAMAIIQESRPLAMTDPELFAAALDKGIGQLVQATLQEKTEA